jgi:hypothetical protein
MTDELVQRLRKAAETAPRWLREIYDLGADEIERLRAESKQHFDQAMANGASAAAERDRAVRAESELAALRKRVEG